MEHQKVRVLVDKALLNDCAIWVKYDKLKQTKDHLREKLESVYSLWIQLSEGKRYPSKRERYFLFGDEVVGAGHGVYEGAS